MRHNTNLPIFLVLGMASVSLAMNEIDRGFTKPAIRTDKMFTPGDPGQDYPVGGEGDGQVSLNLKPDNPFGKEGGLYAQQKHVSFKDVLTKDSQSGKKKLTARKQTKGVENKLSKMTKNQGELKDAQDAYETRMEQLRNELVSGEFKGRVDELETRTRAWERMEINSKAAEESGNIAQIKQSLESDITERLGQMGAEDSTILLIKGKIGELQLKIKNPGFFGEGVKYREGRVFGSLLIGVTLVSFIVWGIATGWFDRVAHPNQPQTPVIAEVIKHESSTKTMLQEACVEMQSAAVRFEGNAREMYPGGKYDSMLTALEPVWNVAYEEASRYINGNLSALPIVGWGASAPLPVLPYVSNHASVADSAKIAKQVEQDLDQHALNEFARPFYLHEQFSQQHIEAIDEAAFQSIVNAQESSFSTHSDLFYKAYTGMYSVLDISRECYPYIHEDKATRARYKQLRAIQTVRDANTEAILDGIFDARSALPAIEPLPAVQATA